MIEVFDRHLLELHRNRVAANGYKHDFLFRHQADLLMERLDDFTRSFHYILEIGCRGGYLSKMLRRKYPQQRLTLIDSANTMLQSALTLLSPDDFLRGKVVSDETIPFQPHYFDLVISNLYLHWVNDLPGYLAQIRRCLQPDGLFLGCLFGGETLRELRQVLMEAELELTNGVSPRVSPFAGLQDMAALMQRAGFALPVIDHEIVTVTYSNMRELLKDIQGMGESNTLKERQRKVPPRLLFAKAAQLYQERYKTSDNKITASFEIIYLCGWAPHPSQQQALKRGSAKVRLADALGVTEQKAGDKTP